MVELKKFNLIQETFTQSLAYFDSRQLRRSDYIEYPGEHQRGCEWSKVAKAGLIESILVGIPIAPIYVFEKHAMCNVVIDGIQRVRAIHEFLRDRFELAGLRYASELNGKRFSQLDVDIQKKILKYELLGCRLMVDNWTYETIHDICYRLRSGRNDVPSTGYYSNTGGYYDQRLMNVAYPSYILDKAMTLARSLEFTTIWDIPAAHDNEWQTPSEKLLASPIYTRFIDVRKVLRILALYAYVEDGSDVSMDELVRRFMCDGATRNGESYGNLSRRFYTALNRLARLHDGWTRDAYAWPIRRSARLSLDYMREFMMVALMRMHEKYSIPYIPDVIRSINDLVCSDTFTADVLADNFRVMMQHTHRTEEILTRCASY